MSWWASAWTWAPGHLWAAGWSWPTTWTWLLIVLFSVELTGTEENPVSNPELTEEHQKQKKDVLETEPCLQDKKEPKIYLSKECKGEKTNED